MEPSVYAPGMSGRGLVSLEYRVLVDETNALTASFRSCIEILYKSFYSKGLVSENLLPDAVSTTDVDWVIRALQARVKHDPSAFNMIVQVLRETPGMEYLARRLEIRLIYLQEEHMTQLGWQKQYDQGPLEEEEVIPLQGESSLMSKF